MTVVTNNSNIVEVLQSELVEQHYANITNSIKHTAVAILHTAQCVSEAKRQLNITSFKVLAAKFGSESSLSKWLTIGARADALMIHVDALPSSRTSLYHLSRLTDDKFNECLSTKQIHACMTNASAAALLDVPPPSAATNLASVIIKSDDKTRQAQQNNPKKDGKSVETVVVTCRVVQEPGSDGERGNSAGSQRRVNRGVIRTNFHSESLPIRKDPPMRIARNTIAVLRNFSKINTGLRFEKGHTLRTVHPQQFILAETLLDEECPADACLFSLKDFLCLIARSENPLQLTFDTTASDDFPEGSLTVQEVGTLNRIGSVGFCPPTYVRTPKQRMLVEKDFSFDLTAADLAYLTTQPDKRMREIMICSSGDTVRLQKMIDDSIFGFIEVRNTVSDTAPCQSVIKTEYLKRLMTGPYSVGISRKGVAHFRYKGFPLEYWVMLEKRNK